MVKYKLEGYTSGGYKSSREIIFDGKIEKLWKRDPKHPNSEQLVSYYKVTHPNGKTTEEDDEFLQNILNRQSYIENFSVTAIIVLNDKIKDDDLIQKEKKYNIELSRIQFINFFYKTRYLLILPLFYLFGQWLEGPPTRIIILSNTFILTISFLLIYVVMYFHILNPKKYPLVSWIYHIVLIGSYLNIQSKNQIEVDKYYEVTSGFFLGVVSIHFIFWFLSLFDKKLFTLKS